MMLKIMFTAGEASGDMHAGNLLKEITRQYPQITSFGIGGENLKSAGTHLLYSVTDMAVIGFSEIIKKRKFFKSVISHLSSVLDKERPDVLIAVDYGGFNLRFIPHAKARGIPVIYYISPQVWASRPKRVEIIRRYADKIIVLLPFEVSFYRRRGVEALHFGNPLADAVKISCSRAEIALRYGLDLNKRWVALLPGSRRREVKWHYPLMEKSAALISAQVADIQFIRCIPSGVSPFYEEMPPADDMKSVEGDTYNIVGHSDFAIVCSGTATLETALLGTPMVIMYKTDYFTYWVGRHLLRVKPDFKFGMPNIITGKDAVPEFLAYNTKTAAELPGQMASAAIKYLTVPAEMEKLRTEIAGVKILLPPSDAYRHTAEYILSFLAKKNGHESL